MEAVASLTHTVARRMVQDIDDDDVDHGLSYLPNVYSAKTTITTQRRDRIR